MWSQYAGGHKGMCLAFSKNKIISAIKERFKNCLVFHGPVSYMNGSKRALEAQGIDTSKIKTNEIEDYFKNYIIHFNDTLFFEKLKDYRDEREYRFVVFNEQFEGYEYIDIAGILEGVIAGMYFEKN